MGPVIVIFVLIVNLLFDIFMANRMCGVASDKGYDPKEYHIWRLCFWIPVYGYMYVISLPDIRIHEQNAEIIKLLKSSDIVSNYVQQKQKSNGYDLSQLPSMSVPDSENNKTWVCRRCKERNTYEYSECQKCGTHK